MRAWLVIVAIASVSIVVDQLTKSWALEALRGDQVISWPLGVELRLVYNPGIAFGLGEGWAPILVVFALVGLIVLLMAKRTVLTGPTVFAAGIVLGGALGNLCDRLFRNTGGAVVDFVDIGSWSVFGLGGWPVFNIADSLIVIGAVILVLSASRKHEEEVV